MITEIGHEVVRRLPQLLRRYTPAKDAAKRHQPVMANTKSPSATRKFVPPRRVLLAGPPTSGEATKPLRIKLLSDQEFKEIVSEKMPNAGLYKSLLTGPVGKRMIAKQVFMWGQSYTDDKAVALYLKMAGMRQFKGTPYQRRAYKLVGDIYASRKHRNVAKAVKYYTASLNPKRPALNLPQYYAMAKLYDRDSSKLPPTAAIKYYLLLYKGYKAMRRIYATTRVSLAFSEDGFDLEDSERIVEALKRLIEAYNVRANTKMAAQLLLDLKPLLGDYYSASAKDKKIFLASAKVFYARIQSALSAGKPGRAVDALKGLAHIILVLEYETEDKIEDVIKDATVLLRSAAGKYRRLKRYDTVQELMRWMSHLLPSTAEITDDLAKEYLDLMKLRTKRGEYAKALQIYTMAQRVFESVAVKSACSKRRLVFVGCNTDDIDMMPSFKEEAFVALSHSVLNSSIKAKKFAALRGSRNRARAAMYLQLARGQFKRARGLFSDVRQKDADFVSSQLKIAGLYELVGNTSKAITAYKAALRKANKGSQEWGQASIRLALLEGRSADAKKLLEKTSYRDSYHSGLRMADLVGTLAARARGKLVRAVRGIAIKRVGDNYAFYDIRRNTLLTIVRGKKIRVSKNWITLPPDSSVGRRFTVKLSTKGTGAFANYDAMIETMRTFPSKFYAGLRVISFDNTSPATEAGNCAWDEIEIHLSGGTTSTISHEIGHLWDNMKNPLMKIFRSISWKGHKRLQEDQRDFLGWCNDPRKCAYVKPSKSARPIGTIRCTGTNSVPYGMMNRYEDFATHVASYFVGGKGLRKTVLKQLQGSFLFAKEEFTASKTPALLLQSIRMRFKNLQLTGSTDLAKLNSLITMPSFYAKHVATLMRGLDGVLRKDSELKDLIKKVDDVKDMAYAKLDKDQQRIVAELNRRLLERIPLKGVRYMAAKTDNVEPALKYLFVRYLTPFAGKEYGLAKTGEGIDLFSVESRLNAWIELNPNAAHVQRGLAILRKIKYTKQFYRIGGAAWRSMIRVNVQDGKFKDALRYLRIKYREYRGKEFLNRSDPDDKALTPAEIKKALVQWQAKGNVVDAKVVRAINAYARRYR